MQILEMQSAHLQGTLAIAKAMDCKSHLDLDWLRYRTIDDPTCLQELLLVAQTGEKTVGFCFGCVRDGQGVIKLFGVDEDSRRKSIATALFDEIEARFRAKEAEEIIVGGVAPNYFCPGVSLQQAKAISFLLRRGYRTDRSTRVDMKVDLRHLNLAAAETLRDLAGQGIELRRAKSEEIELAAGFAQEQFSEGWRCEVRASARFDPTPLFIALHHGRCVGFAAYDVTGTSRFGPTGTHPDYRQRGIGSALLKMCLHSIRNRGDEVAEIGWVGPIDYYARAVGARINKAYWLFHKSLDPASQD